VNGMKICGKDKMTRYVLREHECVSKINHKWEAKIYIMS
jgi:hypothetical protein